MFSLTRAAQTRPETCEWKFSAPSKKGKAGEQAKEKQGNDGVAPNEKKKKKLRNITSSHDIQDDSDVLELGKEVKQQHNIYDNDYAHGHHFNYDLNYGHEESKDFTTHLSLMAGNFLVLWLYGKYCQLSETADIEKKYNVVRKTLKEKFTKVYDSDNFENSWTEIANELKVDVEPRLNSNEGGKAYKNVAKLSDLSEEFITWHRSYNQYDYKLYEEFCA